MRLVPIRYLKKNSTIAIDILDDQGRIMLKKGQKITQGGITILNNLGIDAVYIEDEYCFNHTANQSTMALSNIFEYIEGFKAIGHRINDGTSNGKDIVKATEIAIKLVDDLLLLDKNSKIVYEPTKLRASSVIEQNIYVAMMATTLGLKANSLGMLNYIGSVIIPNESALFRIS